MATASVKSDDLALVGMEELEARLDTCRGLIDTEPSAMKRTVLIAKAMKVARQYVGSNIEDLATLAGTSLGFLTDVSYEKTRLIDPLTEAAVLGLPFVGNCFNVLAGRCYVTKQGWEHRFRTHGEASWPELHIGEIEMAEEAKYVDLPEEKWYQHNGKTIKQRSVPGMARCACWAKCIFRGVEIRVQFVDMSRSGGLDERIAIKVNRGMTEDAVRGKVEARLYKALWRLAMGAGPGTGDDSDDSAGTIDATARQSPPADEAADPEPGSFAEYSALMARATTVKETAEVRCQYQFDGELADRANALHAARKAEIRSEAP